MCVTNSFVEETMKSIRSFESGEVEEKKLAELLANIKTLQDCLDENEKAIKARFKESYSGEVYYFPSVSKKVYLSEGRKSSEYDLKAIQEAISPANFLQIITIHQSKVNELGNPLVAETVERNKRTEVGAPYVTVYKMNKQELVEHRS